MIGLILTLLIGLGIIFVSRNINSGINLSIGVYKFSNIPLFIITVGTYLLGILLAWIIEVPQSIATAFQIMGLGRTIKSGNNTISQLQNKIKSLEMENTRLQQRNNQSIIVNKQPDGNYKPNIIQNFLHKLHLR
jgi:hypothetical protein